MTNNPKHKTAATRQLLSRTFFYLICIGALLFVSAGTLAWPAAWIYLGLTAIVSIGGGLWLGRHDPALLAERLKPMIQRNQKPWDKLFMTILLSSKALRTTPRASVTASFRICGRSAPRGRYGEQVALHFSALTSKLDRASRGPKLAGDDSPRRPYIGDTGRKKRSGFRQCRG